MSSPEEIQLADDLRNLTAGQRFAPDIETIEHRGRRQRQRALALRGIAGLGALGVAVAGGLVATAHAGGPGKATASAPGKATASAPSVRTETVAYVRTRIQAAQDPAGSLVKTRQNTSAVGSTPQMITIWTDPSTGNTMLLEGSGPTRVTYWEHDYYDKNRVLHWDQTQVNYGPRTWWTYNQHAAGPIQGPVPSGPVGGHYTPASQVKKLLTAKGVTIVGHPVINGHHTIELSFGKAGLLKWDYWVDSSTYQVVQMEKFFPATLNAPPIKADYTWVPRTAAMTARINHPVIPSGFTQVAYGQG